MTVLGLALAVSGLVAAASAAGGPPTGAYLVCGDFGDVSTTPAGFAVSAGLYSASFFNGASFLALANDMAVTQDDVLINATFPIHLHTSPCDVNDGGGHWKFNTSVSGAVESNELWAQLDQTVTPSTSSVSYNAGAIDATAVSIVVHQNVDGAAPKRACCDLQLVALLCGQWVSLDGGVTTVDAGSNAGVYQAGADIQAGLDLFGVKVNGVASNETLLNAYVTTQKCSADNGGAHWQSEAGASSITNEIWLTGADGAMTMSNGDLTSGALLANSTIRMDAMSIVVHRGAAKTAALCCDFFVYTPEVVATTAAGTGGTTAAAGGATTTAASGSGGSTTAAADTTTAATTDNDSAAAGVQLAVAALAAAVVAAVY